MSVPAFRAFARATLVIAIATLAAGCATRFDAQGNQIYVWQYGQGSSRDIDYSNPRMPILPPQRPTFDLWPVPSPYDFTDLSPWASLRLPDIAPESIDRIATPSVDIGVGDNHACAACQEATLRLALAAPRADARDGSRVPAGR